MQFTISFLLALPFIYYQRIKACFGIEAFVFSMICNGIFLVLFIRFRETAYSKKGDKKVKAQ